MLLFFVFIVVLLLLSSSVFVVIVVDGGDYDYVAAAVFWSRLSPYKKKHIEDAEENICS